ncbi:hypothetical protein QAD02_000632 [Eretmocerus hayati]|uniref:Uncharacterized protein n=1 Tax=Eretmocerus hayati TaxID=131215 RepID=A0ACC2NEL2_9HYME|nr:hypothetical protein QAD02_000632 [Eretmocerus hayati]
MGSFFSTSKNTSVEYRDYPPGCVPCPQGYKPGNPGIFTEFHKNFDTLEPRNFDGARIIAKKTLSKHFNVTHSLVMTSLENQRGYKFGASYIGPKKVGPRERYPILEGDIRPNGDVTAKFVHTLGCRYRIKVSTKIQNNKYRDLTTTLEYRSDDFTLSTSLVNPSVLKQEGIFILQFLQAISSRMTLGAEIACQKSSKLPSGKETNVACAFRYSTGFRTFSSTVGHAGIRVCYHHRQSRNLQMGVEFSTNYHLHHSKARILFQLDAPTADMMVKGFVDTDCRVGAVFEKRLYPIPEASLILSGILDHSKQNISVGIGLNIA